MPFAQEDYEAIGEYVRCCDRGVEIYLSPVRSSKGHGVTSSLIFSIQHLPNNPRDRP